MLSIRFFSVTLVTWQSGHDAINNLRDEHVHPLSRCQSGSKSAFTNAKLYDIFSASSGYFRMNLFSIFSSFRQQFFRACRRSYFQFNIAIDEFLLSHIINKP